MGCWKVYRVGDPESAGDPNCAHDAKVIETGYYHGDYIKYRCKKCGATRVDYSSRTPSHLGD